MYIKRITLAFSAVALSVVSFSIHADQVNYTFVNHSSCKVEVCTSTPSMTQSMATAKSSNNACGSGGFTLDKNGGKATTDSVDSALIPLNSDNKWVIGYAYFDGASYSNYNTDEVDKNDLVAASKQVRTVPNPPCPQ